MASESSTQRLLSLASESTRRVGARAEATYYKLTATDRESLVVLGDPTAMLGRLPSQVP